MLHSNFMDYTESKPGAGGLPGDEGFEYSILQVSRDAWPVIADMDLEHAIRFRHSKKNLTARFFI